MVDDGCCFSMTMITTMCSNSKATWPPLATRWWNYSALRFTAIVRLTHIQPHLNSYQERACINSSVSGVSCYCTNQIAGRDLCDCCSMMGNDVETVLRCIWTFSCLFYSTQYLWNKTFLKAQQTYALSASTWFSPIFSKRKILGTGWELPLRNWKSMPNQHLVKICILRIEINFSFYRCR